MAAPDSLYCLQCLAWVSPSGGVVYPLGGVDVQFQYLQTEAGAPAILTGELDQLPGRPDVPAWRKALMAAGVYVSRKHHRTNPHGYFDHAGRWYPSDLLEWADCCGKIRSPSRRWPFSYMVHCRSLTHICTRFGVDMAMARRWAKWLEERPQNAADFRMLFTWLHPQDSEKFVLT
jgi:hypothetical protein